MLAVIKEGVSLVFIVIRGTVTRKQHKLELQIKDDEYSKKPSPLSFRNMRYIVAKGFIISQT